MFCPNCGLEQASQEIRYCPRCGFSFEIVAQLLGHGGYLPQLAEFNEQPNRWLIRSNGLKLAVIWFLAFTFFLAPVFAAARIDGVPEFFAAVGVFGGLLIVVFSLIFLKKARRSLNVEQSKRTRKTRRLKAVRGGNQNALPPQQSVPASAYVPPMDSWKAPDTYDLNRPGSVTEGTTQLLEKDN